MSDQSPSPYNYPTEEHCNNSLNEETIGKEAEYFLRTGRVVIVPPIPAETLSKPIQFNSDINILDCSIEIEDDTNELSDRGRKVGAIALKLLHGAKAVGVACCIAASRLHPASHMIDSAVSKQQISLVHDDRF